MLTEQFFVISSVAHEGVLWFLILLSVVSLAIIMDRFFFLYQGQAESSLILKEMMLALGEWQEHSHEACV